MATGAFHTLDRNLMVYRLVMFITDKIPLITAIFMHRSCRCTTVGASAVVQQELACCINNFQFVFIFMKTLANI